MLKTERLDTRYLEVSHVGVGDNVCMQTALSVMHGVRGAQAL